jgi:hypothetical protein
MGGCGRRSAISYCTGLFRALADQHPGNAFFSPYPALISSGLGRPFFKAYRLYRVLLILLEITSPAILLSAWQPARHSPNWGYAVVPADS